MSEVRDQNSALGFTDPIASLRNALKGRYEIERQIGQGAFATVYLARDLKHERKVAIKVLNADPESETGEIRFIREIRLVARLQHPNILPLHDSGHVEALLYYVMPYVTGETLRIRMHRERQMGVEAACAIARETADALAYAHSQGIVHRDIKPENILLSGGHAIVADFGIARAIDVGGVRQLTMTGVAGPGTPAYMSPEQLLGDRAVDARSDIYSLGCVLHEMLAGKPPFPGKDGFVKRFTEPPPHISSLRRDAPPWVDPVIAKALAKDPGDRYLTAADLVAALSAPIAPVRARGRDMPGRHALASPPMFAADPLAEQELSTAFPDSYPSADPNARLKALAPIAQSRPRRWLTAARAHPLRSGIAGLTVLGAVAVGAAASKPGSLPAMFGLVQPLDSTRYALLGSMSTGTAALHMASQISDSLYDALTKLEGSPVVAQSRVAQAITDGAPPPTTEAAAIELARRVGAGKAIWIQIAGTPQLPRARVYLYDARSAEVLDEFPVRAAGRGEEYYAAAAYRLFGLGNRPVSASGCDGRTRVFRAWDSCSRGHIALANWELSASERSFREALAADPAYAAARVWLGQLLAWRTPERRSEWYDLARRASESGNLHPRDRLVATGLTALSERRFPAACSAYGELVRADSLDFLGWYGMGECQSSDNAVLPSASSPSKWAFRTSSHSAMKAYMTALRIQPGAYEIFPVEKLVRLIPVSAQVTRTGLGGATGRELYLAFPTLEAGDTIGFIPYPGRLFWQVKIGPDLEAALRRNRETLKEFTGSWAERFPRSARAQEAVAVAFEARDELGEGPPSASPALRAIDSAVALLLAKTGDAFRNRDVIRLRARKVRVHFKRGEFAAARALADSILTAPATPESYEDLQWLAALIGRADLAAHYWQQSSISNAGMAGGRVNPAVATPANKYFTYAALGICEPQLSAARAQLESALGRYVPKDIRDSVRSDLTARAARLAMPCTKGRNFHEAGRVVDKLFFTQEAFSRGDSARTRELLVAAARERGGRRPGDTSADYVFQEAWLRTQVGDTAAAVASLDAALGALPTFAATSFFDVGVVASFARMIVLRVEIAAKSGDVRTARRWADALNQLWASADPPLRTVATQLRNSLKSQSDLR